MGRERDRGRARPAASGRALGQLGQYWLQAAIVAEHARAASAEETNWPRICQLYEHLLTVTRSPIVALNRAIAVSMADGPAAGLRLLEPFTVQLDSYLYLHAATCTAGSATALPRPPPTGGRTAWPTTMYSGRRWDDALTPRPQRSRSLAGRNLTQAASTSGRPHPQQRLGDDFGVVLGSAEPVEELQRALHHDRRRVRVI